MIDIGFLAEWALRSSILVLVGALLLRALRVKDSSICLASWTAILCCSLAIPILTNVAPRMPLRILPPSGTTATAPQSEPTGHQTPAGPAASHPAPRIHGAPDWPVILYALVAIALLARLATGLVLSRRLLRGSRITTLAPDIRESDTVVSPAVLGIIRPAIVLPADWRDWDLDKLDAVLAHERSHILRRDPAVQLLSAIHRAILWHSPLSWYLHRHIVRAAEDASDDAAVAATRDPAAYAATLLEFIRRTAPTAHHSIAMARYGAPEHRIQRILDATTFSRGLTRRSLAAIIAVTSPLAFVIGAAHPQDKPSPAHKDTLTFEAASVKPATVPAGVTLASGGRMMSRKGTGVRPPSNTGGPGTNDPGRIHFELVALKTLLDRGWKSFYEIKGPDWLETQAVAVDATMPPTTTEPQFQEMLRNLVTERFALKYHIETKEIPGYNLTVAAGGPKIKQSVIVPLPPDAPPVRATYMKGSSDGFPVIAQLPPGSFHGEFGSDTGTRMLCQWCDMPKLVDSLHRILNAPVTDATGLTAKYDYILTFARDSQPGAEPSDPLPTIFAALPSQLGLKLDKTKTTVEIMVVDHMERAPSGN
jgi:uncharacterized protein (TIGR03435 family)